MHNQNVAWEVEFVGEFERWWDRLTVDEQFSIVPIVRLLERFGPSLRFPHSSGISGSKHSHMRELRVQHQGRPYRILYAFDPTRTAVLLLGGDKTGNERWYDEVVPRADYLYDAHLIELKREGKT